MDTTEIQSRLDRACGVANKKGLITPAVTFQVVSHKHLDCYLTTKEHESKWDSYEFFRGDTPEEILSKLDAHVAGLPTLKEAKFNQFMAALGRVIDLGKKNDVEVEFLNPLVATMKRLSENAITHKVAA